MTYSMDFLSELFRVIDQYQLHADLFTRAGPKWGSAEPYNTPASFFLKPGDVLAWGGADVEEVTPETLPVLRAACEDLEAIGSGNAFVYGSMLFVCRVNNSRPQHAVYPADDPAIWSLLDACGPEREVGLGNPYSHPSQGGPEWERKKKFLPSAERKAD